MRGIQRFKKMKKGISDKKFRASISCSISSFIIKRNLPLIFTERKFVLKEIVFVDFPISHLSVRPLIKKKWVIIEFTSAPSKFSDHIIRLRLRTLFSD